MGISGLLPAIRDALKTTTISSFSGRTAGIDGFIWLHRGCLGCAREVARGERSTKYISFFMQQVQFLLNHRISPLIVFDGSDLPGKSATNETRRTARLESLRMAEHCESLGLHSEADAHYARSVEITPELLFPLFAVLRKRNIPFIVAPYEADAQLAFLCHHQIVDFVITEDSDLLAYHCPLTVFKLDRSGNCQSLQFSDLFRLPELAGLSAKAFTECCILAGCDYLDSIPRMGFRTAVRRILAHRTAEALIAGLRSEGKWEVPDGYEADFRQSFAIFRSQTVFDPVRKVAVGIFDESRLAIAGGCLAPELARGIAEGKINPRTRQPYGEEETLFEHSQSPFVYHTPVSESAARQFKPHFESQSPPKLMTVQQPRRPTFAAVKFIPPSLRRLHSQT
jgi:exonuclease-1